MSKQKSTANYYTITDLANLYSIHRHTCAKWLKFIAPLLGPKIGGRYSSRQAQIIFEVYGHPNQSQTFDNKTRHSHEQNALEANVCHLKEQLKMIERTKEKIEKRIAHQCRFLNS